MKRHAWIVTLIAAAAVGGSAWGADRVLVIPFNVLNVPAAQQWIGKGVEENLVAQLSRSGGMVPVAYSGAVIVEDNATAVRLARNANAALAIRGTAQVVGEDLRLTAQLIDTQTGDTVRTGLVTGKTADLLKLEDELAGQLRGEAATVAVKVPPPAVTPPVSVPVAVPPQPVVVIQQPQPVYYPVYTYPNYYGGGYPWYGNVVIYQTVPGGRGRGPHDGRGGGGGGGGGRGGGNGGGGGGGGMHQVPTGGGYNPNALPLPTNLMLPLPTNNVLPLPTNNVLPLPTKSVLPLPTKTVLPLPQRATSPAPANRGASVPTAAPATPRAKAVPNRNPRLVN